MPAPPSLTWLRLTLTLPPARVYRRNLEKSEGSWDPSEAEEHARWLDRSRKAAHTQHGREAHERWMEEQPPLTARSRRAREAAQIASAGSQDAAAPSAQRHKTTRRVQPQETLMRVVVLACCMLVSVQWIAAMSGWSLSLEDIIGSLAQW